MNGIDISWSEALRVGQTLGAIYGLIIGSVILAYVVSRPVVVSFVERRWALLISAGLMVGSIFAIALALHVTNGHPQPSNVLLWIGLACFITALWRLAARPSV